jgi:hypothetical protein
MKAKYAVLIVAMALFLSAGLAHAATKMELARQYFELINFEENIKAAFSAVAMRDMVKAMKKAAPEEEISEEKMMAQFKKLKGAFTQSDYLKQLKEETIKITAEVFSKDELKALVAFYSSKEGKSIIEKMPAYAQQTQAKIGKMTIPLVEKMVKETIDKDKNK